MAEDATAEDVMAEDATAEDAMAEDTTVKDTTAELSKKGWTLRLAEQPVPPDTHMDTAVEIRRVPCVIMPLSC